MKKKFLFKASVMVLWVCVMFCACSSSKNTVSNSSNVAYQSNNGDGWSVVGNPEEPSGPKIPVKIKEVRRYMLKCPIGKSPNVSSEAKSEKDWEALINASDGTKITSEEEFNKSFSPDNIADGKKNYNNIDFQKFYVIAKQMHSEIYYGKPKIKKAFISENELWIIPSIFGTKDKNEHINVFVYVIDKQYENLPCHILDTRMLMPGD